MQYNERIAILCMECKLHQKSVNSKQWLTLRNPFIFIHVSWTKFVCDYILKISCTIYDHILYHTYWYSNALILPSNSLVVIIHKATRTKPVLFKHDLKDCEMVRFLKVWNIWRVFQFDMIFEWINSNSIIWLSCLACYGIAQKQESRKSFAVKDAPSITFSFHTPHMYLLWLRSKKKLNS